MNKNKYFLVFSIYLLLNKHIMRKKLDIQDKKIRVTITLNREIDKLASEQPNKSKYIEQLIYADLRKNNKINETLL